MSDALPQRSLAERRMRLEQALANTRIEGHQPSPEFLADMEAMITGQLSDEEVRRRIIERAKAADRQARTEELRRAPDPAAGAHRAP